MKSNKLKRFIKALPAALCGKESLYGLGSATKPMPILPPLYASHYHTLRPGRITDYVHVAAVAQPAAWQEEEEEYLPHQQAVNFNK